MVYAAYWAFNIRRALTVPLYRKQAFGLGLFALIILLAVLPSPTPGSKGLLESLPFEAGYLLVTSVFWLGALYFVDASVLVSRRSDPLLRDPLHWRKVRYVLWGLQGLTVSYILLAFASAAITGNASLLEEIWRGNNGALTSPTAIIVNLAWAIVFASIIVFVPVAIRTRDPTLRRHFKWLAVFAVIIFILLFTSTYGATAAELAVGTLFGFLAGAYCLYKSAKALVPLNRMSLEPAPKS